MESTDARPGAHGAGSGAAPGSTAPRASKAAAARRQSSQAEAWSATSRGSSSRAPRDQPGGERVVQLRHAMARLAMAREAGRPSARRRWVVVGGSVVRGDVPGRARCMSRSSARPSRSTIVATSRRRDARCRGDQAARSRWSAPARPATHCRVDAEIGERLIRSPTRWLGTDPTARLARPGHAATRPRAPGGAAARSDRRRQRGPPRRAGRRRVGRRASAAARTRGGAAREARGTRLARPRRGGRGGCEARIGLPACGLGVRSGAVRCGSVPLPHAMAAPTDRGCGRTLPNP